jgi:O-antigen/teichoic acid export membrane protein
MALTAATVLQTALGIALVPLATMVLSAADFGLYALLMSMSALAGVASDGGVGIVFPAHYVNASLAERGRMFASFAYFSAAIGTSLGLIILVGWSWRHALFAPDYLDAAPPLVIALTAAMMPLRAVGMAATNMFSAGGRGMAIAVQLAVQAIVNFVVAVLGLFVFDMHVTALFVGALAGLASNLGVSLAILRRSYGALVPSRQWLARVKAAAPTAGAIGLLDGTRSVLENGILAGATGLSAVGYWGHARLYPSLLTSLANSVSHNIWGIALADAQKPKSKFEVVGRVWTPVQLLQVMFGLAFALVGREIVDLISHGKLTPAAVYVAPLIIVTLIQHSGKPATATTFANGFGIAATRFRLVSMTVGTLVLWPAIHMFGIAGLIAVLAVEALAYRLYLVRLAVRVRSLPFQDGVVVAGIAAIVIAAAGVTLFEPPFLVRLLVLSAILLGCVLAYRHYIADLFVSGRGLIFEMTP